MKKYHLPPSLKNLEPLALNMRWSWHHPLTQLFCDINPEAWMESRNPVKTLLSSTAQLEKLAHNAEFIERVETEYKNLQDYLEKQDTWYQRTYPNEQNKKIAYFCAEYGLHESLPIYSGGLGVLAGDHVKSASDLGVPMIFVGLFYANGYFVQQIAEDGKQNDVYLDFNPDHLPLSQVMDDNGKPLLVDVTLPGRSVSVQIWKAQVGRVHLYLLDSRLKQNTPEDQALTARLYGGDREMRLSQEIILGIGGIRALEKMGVKPDVFHMNEGHSGFFQLERIRSLMQTQKLNFHEATMACASDCVFTTHTPVPAGNETFSLPLMHKYFSPLIKELELPWRNFLRLGLVPEKSDYKYFSLTVFALNVSRFANGVSELHGRIASKMWSYLWENVPEKDNPIKHVTNGVHVDTWMNEEYKQLLAENLGQDWNQHLLLNDENKKFWNKIHSLDSALIKEKSLKLKRDLILFTRTQLKEQYKRHQKSKQEIDQIDQFLNPNALTIGFARRFATYKRATLIFKDLKRLEQLVNDPEKPVQFIFAGKAHPADVPGQKFIAEIFQLSQQPAFLGKIIILENYDMNISRHMISGVDVWLNNPRRPMEASGTSGQKVPLNFGLNFSVLDGWWREGYNGQNGWTIGEEKDYPSEQVQDFEDAQDFYQTLESTILPLYYQQKTNDLQSNGLSQAWLERCAEAFTSTIMIYSMDRVVHDYVQELYRPAMEYGQRFKASNYGHTKKYHTARHRLRRNWPSVTIQSFSFGDQAVETHSKYEAYAKTPLFHVEFPYDETCPGRVFEAAKTQVEAQVYLGEIDPTEVRGEIVATLPTGELAQIFPLKVDSYDSTQALAHFKTTLSSANGKPLRLRMRFYPHFEGNAEAFEFGQCLWL